MAAMSASTVVTAAPPFDPAQITRPDKALLKYYVVIALLTGPGFPLVFLPLLFKYETLKYTFDDTGVSMSWGLLFRREIYLTYRRIQDIHLTRNVLQRWMGLATVSVQTASGGSGPEMSIEGVLQADALRDYLYAQMRGARDGHAEQAHDAAASSSTVAAVAPADEALKLLHEIRDELRNFRARSSSS
jgi:putative membrane protein